MEELNSAVKKHSMIAKELLTTDEKLSLFKAQELFLQSRVDEEDCVLKKNSSEIESLESAINSSKSSLLLNYELLIHHKETCILSLLQNLEISKEKLHLEKLQHHFLASFRVDHNTYHNQLRCKDCKNFPKPCKYC